MDSHRAENEGVTGTVSAGLVDKQEVQRKRPSEVTGQKEDGTSLSRSRPSKVESRVGTALAVPPTDRHRVGSPLDNSRMHAWRRACQGY
jgi:hypothetical protein